MLSERSFAIVSRRRNRRQIKSREKKEEREIENEDEEESDGEFNSFQSGEISRSDPDESDEKKN